MTGQQALELLSNHKAHFKDTEGKELSIYELLEILISIPSSYEAEITQLYKSLLIISEQEFITLHSGDCILLLIELLSYSNVTTQQAGTTVYSKIRSDYRAYLYNRISNFTEAQFTRFLRILNLAFEVQNK